MEQVFFHHHICSKIQEAFLFVKVLSPQQNIHWDEANTASLA